MFAEVGKTTETRPLLDRRRREGQRRHRARPARLQAMRFYAEDGNWDLTGNESTPTFSHQGRDRVPGLHPHPEARPAQPTCSRPQMMFDFWCSHAGEPAPGHDPVQRPRHRPTATATWTASAAHTFSLINAAGERVWVKCPLQDPAGHPQPDRRRTRCGWPARTPTTPPARPARRHRARRVPALDARSSR
ncbi:MAG: catalase [Comamonadaceae bacterium]|nr:catalase [Comamonadaceae bacterium]